MERLGACRPTCYNITTAPVHTPSRRQQCVYNMPQILVLNQALVVMRRQVPARVERKVCPIKGFALAAPFRINLAHGYTPPEEKVILETTPKNTTAMRVKNEGRI